MRTVSAVRIGLVTYGGQDGACDPVAGVWRYPLAVDLLPVVDEDGATREPTAEELRAIERAADLTLRTTVEVPAGEGGVEPDTATILGAVGQAVGLLAATAREAVVGLEIVLGYLRAVEG